MGEVKEYIFEELCQIVGAIVVEYGILGVNFSALGPALTTALTATMTSASRSRRAWAFQYGRKVKMLTSSVCLSV